MENVSILCARPIRGKMGASFRVNDNIRTIRGFVDQKTGVTIPKGTKGKVTWADGDKYLIEIKHNGKKIGMQVHGREIEKTGFFAGR
jgi:hypothetical protein